MYTKTDNSLTHNFQNNININISNNSNSNNSVNSNNTGLSTPVATANFIATPTVTILLNQNQNQNNNRIAGNNVNKIDSNVIDMTEQIKYISYVENSNNASCIVTSNNINGGYGNISNSGQIFVD